MEEEKKQNVIELRPLSKWKRLLVFLGDYFIAAIISFIFFNLVVFPSAKIICDTQNKNNQATALEQQALKMLIDDGYLCKPNDGASFEEDVNYTFKVFLSYYAFDEETPDTSHPKYGHKLENEVVRHYYENVIKDTDQYVIDFKEVNSADSMFDIGDSVDSIVLKNDYKALLANELLEVTDENNYSTAMTNFRDHVFARLFYIHVYNHILENDYVKDGASYKGYLKQSSDILNSLKWVASVSSLISITLSWSIVFVLYPLVNKEKRTITMSVMQINKLHYKSLGLYDNKFVMIRSFYHFVVLLSTSVFLPVLFFGIAPSFNLPLLFVLSAISLLLIIASGVFIIFNEHNRSGSDILTSCVLVQTSELDKLYLESKEDGNEESRDWKKWSGKY